MRNSKKQSVESANVLMVLLPFIAFIFLGVLLRKLLEFYYELYLILATVFNSLKS